MLENASLFKSKNKVETFLDCGFDEDARVEIKTGDNISEFDLEDTSFFEKANYVDKTQMALLAKPSTY